MKKLKSKKENFFKKAKKEEEMVEKEKGKRSGKDREKIGKDLFFPKIYRIITDKRFVISLISLVLLCFIALEAYFLWKNNLLLEKIKKEKSEVVQNIKYWETVVERHPDYRDAYFQLSLLEYRLGEKEKSKKYLQKTLELDPYMIEGDKLGKLLN